jgi:CHAT domain-containing protein
VRRIGGTIAVSALACAIGYAAPIKRGSAYFGEQHTPEQDLAKNRAAHKYDLVEEALLKQHERQTESGNALGMLYAAIDLAEFYGSIFINFRKAIEYWEQAEELNRKVEKMGGQERFDPQRVKFMRLEGRHVLPREYSSKEISANIENQKLRLQHLMSGGTALGRNSELLGASGISEIRTQVTEQASEALLVEPQSCDPRLFAKVERVAFDKARTFFRERHKLTKEQKDFYVPYNVVKVLVRVFDFGEIAEGDALRILALTDDALVKAAPEIGKLDRAYLDFVRVLSLNRLGRHEQATRAFEGFETVVIEAHQEIKRIVDEIKNRQQRTMGSDFALTALTLTGDILLAVATQGAVVGMFTVGSATRVFSNVMATQREQYLRGETPYSKELNIVLDMNEQLKMFRAIGVSYHKMGQTEKSVKYLKESVQIINNLRATISSERDRISFARYKDSLYGLLIDSLMELKREAEAFEVSEQARARALIDLLGSRRDIRLSAGSTGNLEQLVQRQKEIQAYEDYIRSQKDISESQAAYVETLRKQFRGIGIDTASNAAPVSGEDSTKEEEVASLLTMSPLTVPEAQSLLPNDTALIEFYLSQRATHAWILQNGQLTAIRLKQDPLQLRSLIESFLRDISKVNEPKAVRQIQQTTRALYRSLFEPLRSSVTAKQLYVVNHQCLHFLPLETLHDGKHYLAEEYSFAYLPSASVLKFLHKAPRLPQSVLALGNPVIDYVKDLPPLSGAESESQAVVRDFPKGMAHVRADATESVFRREAPKHDVIHLATHGVFDAQDPMNSRVFLARDDQHDGMLTAKKLYGIRLNASLVTLSACQSSVSAVGNGDELIGLIRGFFFAGTPSVVGSLWKVDDTATQEFMELFYRGLSRDKKSIAGALHNAKTKMMHNEQYANPFYWSAFTLSGAGF